MSMTKRSVFTTITPLPSSLSRQTVVDFLHNHVSMIDLNPLVIERHPIKAPENASPDEMSCIWYSLTDKVHYLPGGVVAGNVSYTACFNDLPNGLQTHCRAPAGVDIRSLWTLRGSLPGEPKEPLELGITVPKEGLYLREDVDLRCNFILSSFVKKTLKKAHSVLVERMSACAERKEMDKAIAHQFPLNHAVEGGMPTASPRASVASSLQQPPTAGMSAGMSTGMPQPSASGPKPMDGIARSNSFAAGPMPPAQHPGYPPYPGYPDQQGHYPPMPMPGVDPRMAYYPAGPGGDPRMAYPPSQPWPYPPHPYSAPPGYQGYGPGYPGMHPQYGMPGQMPPPMAYDNKAWDPHHGWYQPVAHAVEMPGSEVTMPPVDEKGQVENKDEEGDKKDAKGDKKDSKKEEKDKKKEKEKDKKKDKDKEKEKVKGEELQVSYPQPARAHTYEMA